MTELTTALDTALQADAPLVFGAIEILLPGYSLRLLDGSYTTTLFGHAFSGRDPTYGTLGTVEAFNDGADQTAPAVRITLNPPTNTAMATLADPDAQGSQVSIWAGAIDRASGLVIADPYLVFLGELDVPTVQIGRNKRTLQFDIVSAFERFFDQDEGVRLNGPWHNAVWPGELGLQYVVDVQQSLPWGSDTPRPVLVTDMGPTSSPGQIAGAALGISPFAGSLRPFF